MVGSVHPVYTPPGYRERYTTLVYTTYHTPGTPTSLTAPTMPYMPSPSVARCGWRRPWAQLGRNPWVRPLLASQDHKGVTKGVPLRAELLLFPWEKCNKDWIDEG